MIYGNYVNNTIQQYGGDLSRPTKYNIILTLPQMLNVSNKNGFSSQLNVLAKNFTLPEIQHQPLEIKYKGHNIPLTGRTNYDNNFTVTFYLDDKHSLRTIIDEWIKFNDHLTIRSKKGSKQNNIEKMGRIVIEAKNYEENVTTSRYTFFNVFPISVSGVEFSSDNVSQVNEISVTFSYTYFETTKGDMDFSNIFEDIVQDGINSLIGNLFDTDKSEDIRQTTTAVVDIFKKML